MRATDGRLAAADWSALGFAVRLLITDADRIEAGRSLLVAELAELDAACSRFRPDSELVALDRAAGRPVRVSPLLADAVEGALRAAWLTDGDVDPTVGQAMAALGYDRDFRSVSTEGPPLRVRVRSVPGWRQVTLDKRERLLTVPSGVRLDLGATAKAWSADRAAARLAHALGCGVLVSLGGDVAVAGRPQPGGWTIRVQDVTGHPDQPPSGPSALVAIDRGGLATSSTAARRWRRGGQPLHHILNPRNGLPAASVWRTVSVAAGSCLDANIASTAAIIRGAPALGWLRGSGLPARLVHNDGTVFAVAGWPAEVAA